MPVPSFHQLLLLPFHCLWRFRSSTWRVVCVFGCLYSISTCSSILVYIVVNVELQEHEIFIIMLKCNSFYFMDRCMMENISLQPDTCTHFVCQSTLKSSVKWSALLLAWSWTSIFLIRFFSTALNSRDSVMYFLHNN